MGMALRKIDAIYMIVLSNYYGNFTFQILYYETWDLLINYIVAWNGFAQQK